MGESNTMLPSVYNQRTPKQARQSFPYTRILHWRWKQFLLPLTKAVIVTACLCLSVCHINLNARLWNELWNFDLADHVLDGSTVSERGQAAHEGLEVGCRYNVVQVQLLWDRYNPVSSCHIIPLPTPPPPHDHILFKHTMQMSQFSNVTIKIQYTPMACALPTIKKRKEKNNTNGEEEVGQWSQYLWHIISLKRWRDSFKICSATYQGQWVKPVKNISNEMHQHFNLE